MTPEPGTVPQAGEQPTSTRSQWLLLFCFALFSLEIGAFLVIFPWRDTWSWNYFPGAFSFIEDLWDEPAFKGGLTGLGLLNIYVALSLLFRLFRKSGSSST